MPKASIKTYFTRIYLDHLKKLQFRIKCHHNKNLKSQMENSSSTERWHSPAFFLPRNSFLYNKGWPNRGF